MIGLAATLQQSMSSVIIHVVLWVYIHCHSLQGATEAGGTGSDPFATCSLYDSLCLVFDLLVGSASGNHVKSYGGL